MGKIDIYGFHVDATQKKKPRMPQTLLSMLSNIFAGLKHQSDASNGDETIELKILRQTRMKQHKQI